MGTGAKGKIFFPTLRFSKLSSKGNQSKQKYYICKFVKFVTFCESFVQKPMPYDDVLRSYFGQTCTFTHKKRKKEIIESASKLAPFIAFQLSVPKRSQICELKEKRKNILGASFAFESRDNLPDPSYISFLLSQMIHLSATGRKEGGNISRRENASAGVIWTNESRSKAHITPFPILSFSLPSHLFPPHGGT